MPGTTPKVLYIAGWGRSGTTLLDNLVGSHHGVFTAGEITRMWELSFLGGRRCGCGVALLDCDLWRAVFERAFGATLPDPRRMLDLQRCAIPVWRTPELVRAAGRGRAGAGLDEYADVLSRLYRAIAAETGASVIVDASKRPPDAVATALADVDPYLLHMVRDPRACAFSWQRPTAEPDAPVPTLMHRHGRLANIGHWVGWNVASELVARVYPDGRYRRLRYEDFMADPRGTLERVLTFLGEPVVGSPFVDATTVRLPGNHTVAGNPKRFRTGEVRIEVDDEWRSRQSTLDRRTATALSLPLLSRYGYAADPRSAQRDRQALQAA